jgi:hypothetical protein
MLFESLLPRRIAAGPFEALSESFYRLKISLLNFLKKRLPHVF